MEKAEEKEIKLSFWQKLKISIINFEHYYLIAADGWKRAVIYLLKLILIFTVILSSFVMYKICRSFNKVCNYAKDELPNFGISNNSFWIDSGNPIIIDNSKSVKIILDDKNPIEYNINNSKKSKKSLIIISKKQIYVSSSYTGDMSYNIEKLCTLLGTTNISKNDLIDVLSDRMLYITISIYTFLSTFIIYFISMIIDILALAFVGYLISRTIGLPLKFSATYAMATSSMSLPIVLTLAYLISNLTLGFSMTYFQIMITIVSYIYMFASLLIMKSNLLKGKSEKEGKEKINPLARNNSETEKPDEE